MTGLAVIGNVSRDETRYRDGRGGIRLGGAALIVSLAAARAGTRASPVCVLGDEFAHLPEAPGLSILDWSAAYLAAGPATSFRLDYDLAGDLTGVCADYGVAEQLTARALDQLTQSRDISYHVCCRRPLDVGPVLAELVRQQADFSVDFYLPSAYPMIRAAIAWLPKASIVFVNTAEYRLLQELADTALLRELVVTDGPRTARTLQFGLQAACAEPPSGSAREVTGAGDVFAGTYLAHRARGLDPESSLPLAVAAATAHVAAPLLPLPAPRGA